MISPSPAGGHDGPYGAPIVSPQIEIPPEWIDYNGHMNVGYYLLAIDRVMDTVFDTHLGLGVALAQTAGIGPYAIQSHINFMAEMLEGASFHGEVILLDADAKRVHVVVSLVSGGVVTATDEKIAMAVDLDRRRSTEWPDWGQERLARLKAEHADLPRPATIGAPIGLRRG